MLSFVDNFEQYFESCVLNTQNPFKGALNKVNGLIYHFEKLSYQNCPRFPRFRICSVARNKNPETPKINKRRSKLENTHYWQLPFLGNC